MAKFTKEDYQRGKILYEDKDRKVVWLGWAELRGGEARTNQYLIIDYQDGVLIDPGGVHIFPHVISAASGFISLDRIKYVFYTHQNPDVLSGIGLFASVFPNAVFLISRLWISHLAHLGFNEIDKVIHIQDRGTDLSLSRSDLKIIPTHFVYSQGSFSLYDPRSKAIFTGEIGSSLMADHDLYFDVDEFDKHVKYIEDFHRRYMNGNVVLRKWISNVRRFDINMLCPHHGAIIRGENIQRFLNWLENLRCGIDIIDEIYGI